MSDGQIHSTGRGGKGNIGKDDNVYVDGEVVREGVYGEPSHAGQQEYSVGRGGTGNMVHTPRGGTPEVGGSEMYVPETNVKKPGEQYADYHTGRGGEGNVHRDKYGGHSKPQKTDEGHKEGLLDKAKHAVGLDKKKE